MSLARVQSQDHALEAWIAAINQTCGRFRADILAERFEGGVRAYDNGALRATVLDAVDTRLYRTRADVESDEDRQFFVVLQLRGRCHMDQAGEAAVLEPGDLTLVDSSRPLSVHFEASSSQLSMVLPMHTLERNLRSARPRVGQRLAASQPVVGLARRLMVGTLRQSSDDGLSPWESEATLDALVNLLRPAITTNGESPGNQERLLHRALNFIDQHIESEELGPEFIARSVGVSVRGLYRLFATRGLVVAQYIRNRRLDFCAELLRQPGFNQKLSALGHTWGFSDSSHFSAAFKARFGVSPGEYRRRNTELAPAHPAHLH